MNRKLPAFPVLQPGRRALLAGTGSGLLASVAWPALAGPTRPGSGEAELERFDEERWPRLLQQLPRPAIVPFSSIHCANCPEAARQAFETRNRLHPRAPLVVVLTDGEEDPQRARASYRSVASRLMMFEGVPAVVRRRVSPTWRGETPWFVLLQRDGGMHMQAGLPQARQWEAWTRTG